MINTKRLYSLPARLAFAGLLLLALTLTAYIVQPQKVSAATCAPGHVSAEATLTLQA